MNAEMEKPILNLQGAIEEANRCLLCHDAPCSQECPADTDPAKFIRQLRMGNLKGAIRTIRRNNVLGAICAHVCPTCRLCEKGCIRAGLDKPIRISEIQAFLMERERALGMQVLKAPKPGDKKIAVIGSGPAGLSAAANLALNGYRVTVYEKAPLPGGILRYGIPTHRLPPNVLDYEINLLENLGIEFRCEEAIQGKGALQKLLHKQYDAVFLAPGLDQALRLGVVGEHAKGVFTWNDFLALVKHPDKIEEVTALLKDKSLVVIGGGSVALDCATSARQKGAGRVYCVSLEAPEELPADPDEKEFAFTSCVRFRTSSRIVKILLDEKENRVNGVEGVEVRWIVPGEYVPENTEVVPNSNFSIPADIIVEAIGTGFSDQLLELLDPLEKQDGLLKVDLETLQTSQPNIFAGGDIIGPGKTVAASVTDGKKAADAIRRLVPLSKPVVMTKPSRPSLSVEFCGITFKNPFCLSASPVGNTAEMISRAFDAGWGGAVFKTLNLEKDYPIIDPTPRLNSLDYGEKRMIGLQNIEMISERPFELNLKDISWLKEHYPERVLIASIMGYSKEGWVELATGAEKAGADMLELNFSCPQMAVEGAGHKVGQTFDLIRDFTKVVKENVGIPVMAKMTPNLTDMIPAALAAKEGGADAISAINTLRAISEVDLHTFSPKPSIEGKGSICGYSGPAVKPVALRFIAEMARSKALDLPLSGMGGIEKWSDAAMFLLMGATTLQATTSVMHYGYRIIEDLAEGLQDYLADKGYESVKEIIGLGLDKLVEPSKHHQEKHVVSKIDPDKCIGCGLCYIACQDGANQAIKFDPVSRKAEVDEDRCVGCLLCKHICPVWDCISTDERDHPVAGGIHPDALNI